MTLEKFESIIVTCSINAVHHVIVFKVLLRNEKVSEQARATSGGSDLELMVFVTRQLHQERQLVVIEEELHGLNISNRQGEH
ncbi:hypothetical protein DPMN_088873 [Dreissena polymorpha]|uniref:Uncharacterized protein n=1 Tax=Dreissena polymorpha TaxID=45954 RepID=A0A9D4QY98_DREPO|nr:hypothetical protein DPMN_088873 [Dreissena polymorpha]